MSGFLGHFQYFPDLIIQETRILFCVISHKHPISLTKISSFQNVEFTIDGFSRYNFTQLARNFLQFFSLWLSHLLKSDIRIFLQWHYPYFLYVLKLAPKREPFLDIVAKTPNCLSTTLVR